jgi:hypothetical protein
VSTRGGRERSRVRSQPHRKVICNSQTGANALWALGWALPATRASPPPREVRTCLRVALAPAVHRIAEEAGRARRRRQA